jgi:hypothetical protein
VWRFLVSVIGVMMAQEMWSRVLTMSDDVKPNFILRAMRQEIMDKIRRDVMDENITWQVSSREISGRVLAAFGSCLPAMAVSCGDLDPLGSGPLLPHNPTDDEFLAATEPFYVPWEQTHD